MNYDPVLYNIQKDVGIRRRNGASKLKKLRPKHREIIALHLQGATSLEICQILDLSYSSVSRILNDPLAEAFINDFDDITRKEFDALRIQANAALRDGLHSSQSIDTRLRAADLFSKRAGDYQPKTKDDASTAEDVIAQILNQINVQVNIGDKQ